MEDIYDRAKWPSPEVNPLVRMLLRGDEWYSNNEIATALELVNTTKSKSVVGHYRDLLGEIGPDDTKMVVDPAMVGSKHPVRVFSRKAMISICMRARTINARAFRDWLATKVAGEVGCG